MDIIICGLEGAVEFVPSKPTYAIAIVGTQYQEAEMFARFPLQESPLYRRKQTYVFDDINHPSPGKIHLTEEIADRIVADFQEGNEGCGTILVYCLRGKNRSPAVAIALNELFHLGKTREELIQGEEIEPNWYVHRMILAAGQRLGIS
jgi:predicted protein tyrosine phosphatase